MADPKLHTKANVILTMLPASWQPYTELCRLTKPAGIINITVPYLYGVVYAAWFTSTPLSILSCQLLSFSVAGFLLRSAGCAWNDIIDRDLDRLVERCRHRPTARGALSVADALTFTALLFVLWLCVLSQIMPRHWVLSIPLGAMVLFYPYAKRMTNFAQVVLGITLSWGVFIGAAANGINFLVESEISDEFSNTDASHGIIGLFFSYLVWCVIHDTIYAQQDIKDDVAAGINSMAIGFHKHLRFALATLAVAQISLQICTGVAAEASGNFHIPVFVGTLVLLGAMIAIIDLDDSRSCHWWFSKGSAAYGAILFVGLLLEYFSRYGYLPVAYWS